MTATSQEKRFSSRASGCLLSIPGLLTLSAGLLLAAWFRQTAIVIVLGLALAAALISWLWSRLSLKGVSCQRWLSEDHLFPGESSVLTLRLRNRKLLPLPWIEVATELPLSLMQDNLLQPTERPGYGILSKGTALLWYTGVSWKQPLFAGKRGYYPLGALTVTSGDIFGFYPRSMTEASTEHVIVYPKIFPLRDLNIPSFYPVGEVTAQKRIFEDPVRSVSLRDYTPQDSLRRINWKASARHQKLQVTVLEPTTTIKAAIFVAVDSFDMQKEEVFELGLSTAASLASYLSEKRSAVGIYVNSKLADSGEAAKVAAGSGSGQLTAILEALARVTPYVNTPFNDFFESERAGLAWGTSLIFVMSQATPAISELLSWLKENGRKPLVIQVGTMTGIPEGISREVIAQYPVSE